MSRPLSILTLLLGALVVAPDVRAAAAPNVIWIVIEDASLHFSCYGETAIETPHLDRIAKEGVRFTSAFVTCPVCSPSRSAMVTGMYQTTLGTHQHRSQRVSGRWSAESDPFASSYGLPGTVPLIPRLFKEHGYYVVNGGTGKTDYNFIEPEDLYAGKDWEGRTSSQPFFAQIQLRGGKFRRAQVEDPVDPESVELPPYYPDHAVLREDWAAYLNSLLHVDQEVGALLARLEKEKILESTAIFLWTDHGISHARGKQFLYDEGVQVPLLVRLPNRHLAGTVRDDLVAHIDVAAASLRLAGIEVPGPVQGLPIFDDDYQPRRRIFTARDRCDETVDIIRSVRTKRFKYIRNFLPHLSHMQPSRYKDGKPIVQTMRGLHVEGKLNELQARIFQPRRPAEELYDLEEDPHETNNLITGTMDEQRAYRDTANELRLALYQWMIDSGDLGLIAEPVLEELGRRQGSKYGVLDPEKDGRLMWSIIETIEAAERGDQPSLVRALQHDHPAVRWWGASGLGNGDRKAPVEPLLAALEDEFVGVRIAAAQALCLQGEVSPGLPVLEKEVMNENRVAGMYAIRGLERIGESARSAMPTIEKARTVPYDFTRRIAERLAETLTP